ncbi:MAG: T9SS type A sorting domain-containing protein [Bacteroidales bacterium]|nr:T9SS type A sorting domain-containing protein [Bacteroidales bacterium]
MRNLILIIICFFIYLESFAQFGGGSGTESDPYRIYTIEHWNEFATEFNNEESTYGDFSGLHLRLMNDITDTINMGLVRADFNGHLNGGEHSITMHIHGNFINAVGEHGVIDSICFTGRNDGDFFIVGSNNGRISQCTSSFDCTSFGPDDMYMGFVTYNMGMIEHCHNYTEIPFGYFYGICWQNFGVVDHCINHANFTTKLDTPSSGIAAENVGGVIRNCINTGNMLSGNDIVAIVWQNGPNVNGYYDSINMHWVNDTIRSIVQNCINIGNITTQGNAHGIFFSLLVGANDASDVLNCLNVGNSNGSYLDDMSTENLRPGVIAMHQRGAKTENCLNIGNTGDFFGALIEDDFICNNNYYDKQMCRSLSIAGEYVDSIAGGRLTTQLTGDTPELRDMLGDGWSYAEGRYPIPLGLETDSLAMLFATPIYLYAESEDEYDDVDLVQHHFTVGTENNVSWASGSRLNIVGENATILASGNENVMASLAGYSFTRSLNLINPVIIDEHIFDDVKIFPNPATDILNITSSETISEIEIVNTLGQVVKRIEVNADNAVCDVEDLRSGVYVVRIRHFDTSTNSVHRKLSVRKFVKE